MTLAKRLLAAGSLPSTLATGCRKTPQHTCRPRLATDVCRQGSQLFGIAHDCSTADPLNSPRVGCSQINADDGTGGRIRGILGVVDHSRRSDCKRDTSPEGNSMRLTDRLAGFVETHPAPSGQQNVALQQRIRPRACFQEAGGRVPRGATSIPDHNLRALIHASSVLRHRAGDSPRRQHNYCSVHRKGTLTGHKGGRKKHAHVVKRLEAE